jgi:RNA polymerase sigma-70 factor (ECF subfamily)
VTEATTELALIPASATERGAFAARSRSSDAADAYRELAPAVLGYLRAHGAADPEDLLGEVFLNVARDIHRFRGDGAACRRWVFTIAHRRLLDSWRRQAVRPRVADARVPDVSAANDRVDTIDPALAAAVAALSPAQREIVLLRFVADLPLRDVARITRRRVGAVKALQHRGLATLERLLAG